MTGQTKKTWLELAPAWISVILVLLTGAGSAVWWAGHISEQMSVQQRQLEITSKKLDLVMDKLNIPRSATPPQSYTNDDFDLSKAKQPKSSTAGDSVENWRDIK